MNENAKNVIFKVLNVAIYVLFGGKFSIFRKCTGVKNLTNIMSALYLIRYVLWDIYLGLYCQYCLLQLVAKSAKKNIYLIIDILVNTVNCYN